ncbi:MAG: nitrate reductase molybdenum cofactor assembly chaperone [Desulfobacterales bacterium]
MTPNETEALRLLAVLLHYPDDDLLSRLDEIDPYLDTLPPGEIKTAVAAFVDHLKTHAPIQVQERYTAAFDMSPATTLNLTYHAYGDNEKRAAVLARLQRHYGQAGWERTTGELPDYLPVMLEFLAICPQPAHTAVVWECLQGMPPLVAGLEKSAPAYAALLQPLARMAAERRGPGNGREHPPATSV